jgi:hypothetical protein
MFLSRLSERFLRLIELTTAGFVVAAGEWGSVSAAVIEEVGLFYMFY